MSVEPSKTVIDQTKSKHRSGSPLRCIAWLKLFGPTSFIIYLQFTARATFPGEQVNRVLLAQRPVIATLWALDVGLGE